MTADVLGSYWTLCGPVEIHEGREWSLFDWPERCAEAARVGMAGLGLWHADLIHLLERRSLAELRTIFTDHGLRLLELEFLNDWFTDEGSAERKASDEYRNLLFDAVAELGVHHIKVGNIFGTKCDRNKVIDAFGELCADAAKRHEATITYEIMPFDVNAPTFDAGLEIVTSVGADNGGLALDFWHLGKFGVEPERLREIPRRYLSYVELSDGQVANMPDHTDETINHRKLPGEGEFDVRGYVRVLRSLGYDGPWGVEVISAWLRSLPIGEIFDRTAKAVELSLMEGDQ